ncbi:hypothetical protein [Pseudonocardia endophytica]|uniref:Uncharacterized protein n=1 Tax=Pseudonocardia endophytica TaxID=401976 RepID=A0A4R1I1Q9_PSEEN|nr:hypothetical protein [Pseudonocardia endophytica]TCK27871.1 hypothetical protein EV378_3753 [Pseudonocardia endophytica]
MTAVDHARQGTRVTRYWPALAGVALAAMSAYGIASGADVAAVVAASGFVYLAAAALGSRAAAWPAFGVSFVLIALEKVVPAADPVATMSAVALVLAVVGVVRGRLRPGSGLPLQGAAMLVLAPVALVASQAAPVLAGLLVAGALLAHAAWDVHHHRTGRVVVRSMAEFCVVLDTVLAVLVLVVTFA